ncbi:MAG TPA: PEGA domain-containing protein [Lacunisphaera sp.]|nr:PEGA domain-containing protein [Lacunisphaera sp.]
MRKALSILLFLLFLSGLFNLIRSLKSEESGVIVADATVGLLVLAGAIHFWKPMTPKKSPPVPEAPPKKKIFVPIAIGVGLIVLVLIVAKLASKSPEEQRAERAALVAKTTGQLAVKSNRANTTIEASRPAAAGETAPPPPVKGNEEGAAEHNLAALSPGTYTVTARSTGWPDISQQVEIVAGQKKELAVQFKSGSLKLDSVPVGATVKFAGATLGKTPLTIPQLPPGEVELVLEYPLWPNLAFKTTVAENVENVASARLPHGRLVLESVPAGATVLFSKRAIGQTPLTIERYQAGTTKLSVEAKDFPPMEVTIAMEDRGEVKQTAVLAMAFPELDPITLLRAVWVESPPEDKEKLSPAFTNTTGYRSRNGIVRNLDRKKLAETWLDKRYRFIAMVKSYDRESGVVEFVEEKGELSRYRVLAKLSPETRNNREVTARLVKDTTFSLYGFLSAVEEPAWPAKVITFEFSSSEPLP